LAPKKIWAGYAIESLYLYRCITCPVVNSHMRKYALSVVNRNMKWTFEDSLHVIVTQQRAPAEQCARKFRFESADEGADLSELWTHHYITLEQWSWGALALQQDLSGNLLLGIAFIFLQRFELDLSFSSNDHSSDAHKRIMSQFICTRKVFSCINTSSVLALVQCECWISRNVLFLVQLPWGKCPIRRSCGRP